MTAARLCLKIVGALRAAAGPLSLAALGAELRVSRLALWTAVDAMEPAGLIHRDGTMITLADWLQAANDRALTMLTGHDFAGRVRPCQ
jgi:hypothetical protein